MPDCKIETAAVNVHREQAMSVTEQVTYQTYDVCTKEVISTYTVPSVSGIGFVVIGIILLISFLSFTNVYRN